MKTTLVVVAEGELGERIAHLSEEHAELDDQHRRVLCPGDPAYPAAEVLARWFCGEAAVVLDVHGEPRVFLDEWKATFEAWIEDAFVRAGRTLR